MHACYHACMSQLTIRADEELVRRVRHAAKLRGSSMNEFIVTVLDSATNPDLVGDEVDRIREKLAAAGLLVQHAPYQGERPSAARIAEAGRSAAVGTSLSEIVSRDRG